MPEGLELCDEPFVMRLRVGATITIVVTATTPGTLTDIATVSASNIGSDADDSATTTTTVTGT